MSLWFFFLLRVKDLKEYIPDERIKWWWVWDDDYQEQTSTNSSQLTTTHQCIMQTKSSPTLQTKHQRSKKICLPVFYLLLGCVGTHPSTQHLIVVTRMKLHYPKSKPLYLPRLHPGAGQGRFNLFAHFVVPWLGMAWEDEATHSEEGSLFTWGTLEAMRWWNRDPVSWAGNLEN